MNFRLPMFSRSLSVLLLLATVVSAQEGEAGGSVSPDQIKAMRTERGKLGGDDVGKEGQDSEKWASMTPEERLNASMRRGSQAYCSFVAACVPPKLLPGQSGTLRIAASLKGDTVLPAPLQMTMIPRIAAEAVSVGNLVAQPALPGTIAEAYLGRPVYENTAVFEVPVTMGPAARLGSKQAVALDLQFDLFSGKSGQTVGRFIERVSAEIEVAPNVDPAISGRTEKPKVEAQPSTPVEPAAKTGAAESAAGAVPDDAMAGVANVVAEEPADPVEPGVGSVPETTQLPTTYGDGGGMPWTMVIGGGAFLLVMVLLLMRKK